MSREKGKRRKIRVKGTAEGEDEISKCRNENSSREKFGFFFFFSCTSGTN